MSDLTEERLAELEATLRWVDAWQPYSFVTNTDVLALIAEVRRLRAQLKHMPQLIAGDRGVMLLPIYLCDTCTRRWEDAVLGETTGKVGPPPTHER